MKNLILTLVMFFGSIAVNAEVTDETVLKTSDIHIYTCSIKSDGLSDAQISLLPRYKLIAAINSNLAMEKYVSTFIGQIKDAKINILRQQESSKDRLLVDLNISCTLLVR